MSIYNFKVKDISKKEISLEEYKGKVLIIVNTASKCGLTPQFEGLENLYKEYKDKGLEILGFPCNQFANQEPNEGKEISDFCQLNYGVTFKIFDKIDVNGENTHELYKYLKKEKKGILGEKIKWNFTKFLVDRDGKVIKRIAPTTDPVKMKKDIEKLLNI